MTLVRLHPMDGTLADGIEIWNTPPLPRSEAQEIAPRLLLEHPEVNGIWLYDGGVVTDSFDLEDDYTITYTDRTKPAPPTLGEIRLRGVLSGRLQRNRYNGKRWVNIP